MRTLLILSVHSLMWHVNLFTALDDALYLSLLCDGVHFWFYVFHATELLISVKRVIVKDWCKTSPFSVMTLLFIGPYFISSSVSGKSFPLGTVDTIIFIYSVHITHGQLSDLYQLRGQRTPTTVQLFVSKTNQKCFKSFPFSFFNIIFCQLRFR